ncbi:MAG: HDOD domain-containing protein [Phycisphaerales bacterium]|nr:HDOD domain-containing protein [Phycisphaerales bacterium]
MGPREVQLILDGIDALPTLAPIATRLLQASASDDFRIEEVTRLIESDPALTARVLRMCSRADTGLGDRVTTVRRAVVMLGIEAVRAAVLAVCVFDLLDGLASSRPGDGAPSTPPEGPRFDRPGFWQHSIGVACASELLARGRATVRPEDAFVAGLLHDLGTLALHLAIPRTIDSVVAAASRAGVALAPVLRRVIGTDQYEAGRRLGRHWGLPEAYIECMWMHGQPPDAVPDGPARELIVLVGAAKAICRSMHVGWTGDSDPPPRPDVLGAGPGVDPRRAREASQSIHARTAERCAMLGLGDATSPDLLLRSLARANESLARVHARLSQRAGTAPGAPARADPSVASEVGAFLDSCQTASGLEHVARAIAAGARGPVIVGVVRAGRGDVAFAAGDRTPDDAPRLGLAPGAADELTRMIDGGDPLGAALHLARAAGLATDAAWNAVVLAGSQHESRIIVGGSLPALNHPGDPRVAAWAAVVRAAAQYERAEGLAQGLVSANRALVEAQSRLTEAEAMVRLGEVTAGAAHEMNNPLTVICGRAQLLASSLKSGPDAGAAREIAGAARELSDLVTQLHALAAPETPRREPLSLPDLVRRAAGLAADQRPRTSGRKDPERQCAGGIRFHSDGPGPLTIVADSAALARALSELIRNAWEAGGDADVSVRTTPEGAEIEVRDSGPGFSPRALRHGFDPFFSERQAGRGRGLGLARCRAIVRLHGGEVTLSNPPGGGARVLVRLPSAGLPETALRAA